MQRAKQNLKLQYILTGLTVIVFALKVATFLMTHSMSVLSDTLESVVNIIATIVGSYSMYIVAKPKDKDHPYGHGKAEFVSSAFQGSLIIGVGCLIIYKAIDSFINTAFGHGGSLREDGSPGDIAAYRRQIADSVGSSRGGDSRYIRRPGGTAIDGFGKFLYFISCCSSVIMFSTVS